MSPDPHRIDARLERIEDLTRRLRETAAVALEEFLASDVLREATAYRVQVAIQAALDVGAHLISTQGWKTAETYRDVFEELAARGVVDAKLGARLARAAGMRNILAHEYLTVDYERIHAGLAAGVRDLDAFCAAVYGWLSGAESA